nr:hypothetical protein CFP56_00306 [Quercus suber]
MLSAMGENRLMPKPEFACKLINAKSGYQRDNNSWILSRMVRDFDYWRPQVCNQIEADRLAQLRSDNELSREKHFKAVAAGLPSREPPESKFIRIGLRVTVWEFQRGVGKGAGDTVYWLGLFVSCLQLGISVIPWALYGEWFSFFVTGAGTLLAYASGALPQWQDEKVGVRTSVVKEGFKERKDVILTEGDGAHDALLIIGCDGGLDLEALASPQRDLPHALSTRVLSVVLAVFWIALLITVAGWEENTWYILAVGMIGVLHNITIAGARRQPRAWGLDLAYRETIVEAKVMEVLRRVEEAYPRAGASLKEEFFNGTLFPREQALWEYAERRSKAWKKSDHYPNGDPRIHAWPMPPLRRPEGRRDDDDIPSQGPYEVQRKIVDLEQDLSKTGLTAVASTNSDFVINVAG